MSSSFVPTTVDRDPDRLRWVRVWLWTCAAMIFAMVVIGGITRLTESGLSITEWRPVTGILPPLNDAAWQAEFAKYQRIPEFREKNATMTLAEFKMIFWWEFVHRLWGRLIGVVFAVPMAWFLVSGRARGALAWKLGGLLALGGLQGAVGWWMVASGLVDRTDVSPYRLAAHLGLALVIFALIAWLALDLEEHPRAERPPRLARLGQLALAGLAVTILAGAFVAGTDAGRIYNTFPMMDGRFVPAGYGDLSPWWLNAFENVAAIQFNHRWLAVTTALVVLAFVGAVHAARRGARATRLASWLGAAVLGQVALGILALLYAVPVSLGALHQAGAVVVLTLALATHHATGRSARTGR
ncbi:MAG: COX15/CtaA family protein [Alphaproteobacteria bacterium]|nr:COX15/CtaA family protein [Alphaproteobacteria bacterium]